MKLEAFAPSKYTLPTLNKSQSTIDLKNELIC